MRWEKDLKETVATAVRQKTEALRAALDQATAAGDERLAKRERESHAAAARTLEAAVREARAMTEALAAALKRAKYGADERPAGRERQAMAEAVPATEEKLDSGAPDSEVEAEDAAGKVAMQAWEAEAAEEESASALASGWRRLLRR